MASIETINKALEILENQDWWWMMADYTHPAIDNARGSMRCLVELVATIADVSIRKALRDLWVVTYDYVHANMWIQNEKAGKLYEARKAELMAIILPLKSGQMKAA